ncbi:hypothetical protein FQN54_007900 [Arachnomyces sp. PD_36]|nr:hypothetical protein FQN54_007900 [Arachnomyces sp. PD_36]
MASKIVVVGNINGALSEVFTKLGKLQAKQNFSFAVVVGDLFGDCTEDREVEELSSLLRGAIQVPLPTYFTVGSREIPKRVVEKLEAEDEVCPNLYYLGRRGTLKTSEGIRIIALGGLLEPSDSPNGKGDKYAPRYTEVDARSLYGAHSADILVTNQWPKSIRTGSQVVVPEGTEAPEGVQCISDLCATLKPRYHLSSAANLFFEREPFFHSPTEDSPDVRPITRFINLASYGNTSKQKWMYAFSLDPKASPPTTIPTGTTASPLGNAATKRRALPQQNQAYQRFSHNDDYQGRPAKRARKPPPGPSECFFCLSNPNIATHLITSIGTDCYLTTAKGPLPTSNTFSSLGFPGHVLIIPLTHSPTFDSISDPAVRSSTYAEMQRYRSALHSMIQTKSDGKLGAVTWEVSRGNGIHIHWQFLPVPADLIHRGLVEAAFKVEAENLKYPKFKKPKAEGQAEDGDYFGVWIWSPGDAPPKEQTEPSESQQSGTENTMVLPLSPDFRFDLQFGRRVMAKLLQLENRINWRDDVQSQEEEQADADAFKEAFKAYDFSLEEG